MPKRYVCKRLQLTQYHVTAQAKRAHSTKGHTLVLEDVDEESPVSHYQHR